MSAEDRELYYRPVSKAASLEFAFSIVSLLAFASPIAWILPVVCLICAIRTSFWLERAKAEYAGQVLVKLAILISLIAALGAPTKHFIERYVIVNEAREACDTFLDLVLANQVREAFAYTLSPVKKIGMETQYDELIVRAGQEYREYLNRDLILKLRGRLAETQVTFLGLASAIQRPGQESTLTDQLQDWIEGTNYLYSGGAYQVALRYRVAMDDGSIFEIIAIMVGGAGEWKGRQWFVGRYDIKPVI